MAIARVFEAKGWTTDDYDAVIDRMELAGRAAPGSDAPTVPATPASTSTCWGTRSGWVLVVVGDDHGGGHTQQLTFDC